MRCMCHLHLLLFLYYLLRFVDECSRGWALEQGEHISMQLHTHTHTHTHTHIGIPAYRLIEAHAHTRVCMLCALPIACSYWTMSMLQLCSRCMLYMLVAACYTCIQIHEHAGAVWSGVYYIQNATENDEFSGTGMNEFIDDSLISKQNNNLMSEVLSISLSAGL